MNALIHLYPGDGVMRLAASGAVQIAIMVGLALVVSSASARRNAALRHGIWLAALAWVCVAPIAAWGLQRAGIAVWRMPAPASIAVQPVERSLPAASGVDTTIAVRIAPSARAGTASNAEPNVVPPIPTTPADAHSTESMSFKAFFGAVTAVWAAGALLLLSRLVWGLRVVGGVRRDLTSFHDLPEEVANRLRMTLGIEILPPIMLSKRVGGPATIGIWRPVVVLPAALAATMSADELHDALAHECAHALRHDARIALAQQLAAAFYWIHPLVHVLNRQLARAREEVCDNVALAGTSPTEYARTLLALSQTMQATRGRIAVVQMFDGRWRLAQRVEGLLNTRRIVMTRMNRRTTALVAALALALGTALAAISTADDQTEDAQAKPKVDPTETSAASNPEAPSKSIDNERHAIWQRAMDSIARNYAGIKSVQGTLEQVAIYPSVEKRETKSFRSGDGTFTTTQAPEFVFRSKFVLKGDDLRSDGFERIKDEWSLAGKINRRGDVWTFFHPGEPWAQIKPTAAIGGMGPIDPREFGGLSQQHGLLDQMRRSKPVDVLARGTKLQIRTEIVDTPKYGYRKSQQHCYVLDTAKNYLPSQVVSYCDDGSVNVVIEMIYDEVVPHKAWFMREVAEKIFRPEKKAADSSSDQWSTMLIYRIVGELRIDEEVKDDAFNIDFPPGTRVVDQVGGRSQ
ncbi:MAG TPA: M56 family metallopeptidase [Pirellulales bacterium]|nr:M56 family metallopeptidase [Pirellulales bacterium]